MSSRAVSVYMLALLTGLFWAGPTAARAQEVSGARAAHHLTRDLQADLLRLAREARSAVGALQQGRPAADIATALRPPLDNIRAAHLLLADHYAAVEAHVHQHGSPAILDRHRQMAAAFTEAMADIEGIVNMLAGAADAIDTGALAASLDRVIRRLESAAPASDRTPLAVSLPYRSLNLTQVEPQVIPNVTPAYASGASGALAPGDLAEAPEVALTPEILAQARALAQDPVRIFEFVRSEIATEFYHGAMKGAHETLRQKRGNDVDQASLLIALMRASGIGARYIRGVIELGGPQVTQWTGLPTRRASEMLARAGIPFAPVSSAGTLAALRVERTWVEAAVPYRNYRGAPIDRDARVWIPLDPSMKTTGLRRGRLDVLQAVDFNAERLIAEYLSGPQTQTPLEFYRAAVSRSLAELQTGVLYEQLLASQSVSADRLGLLPNTLPYATVAVTYEGAALPESLRHKVRFKAEGEGGTSFDVTIPASELLGRRLTLSYVPATVEDHAAVNAFLGLDNTPAYLVKVRPVLMVGGVVRAGGQTPVQMGELHQFAIEVRTPGVTIPISNTLLAGGYYAIGLGAHNVAYEPAAVRPPEDTEGPAAERLFRIAADYLQRWTEAEDEIARLLSIVPVRPALAEVIVGNVYNRTVLFGQPQSVEWRGVSVDADFRTVEPVAIGDDAGWSRAFVRLSGLAGSELEGAVLEAHLKADAVSAAELIRLARAANVAVEEIDAGNAGVVVPALDTADIVKREITDAVNQGWRVTIPRRDQARNIWTGIGYTILDPISGAGGYFISGGLAGGMTTEDPAEWAEQQLVAELGFPYQDGPNPDPNAAAFMRKVAITDKQNGKVGQKVAQPLAVRVRDLKGRPVKDAHVTFVIQAGGGEFELKADPAGDPTTFETTTDAMGIARATPTLGKKTSDSPFYVLADAKDAQLTQVGENYVTARVARPAGDIYLEIPFQLFAYPGDPHHIVKVVGDSTHPDDANTDGVITLAEFSPSAEQFASVFSIFDANSDGVVKGAEFSDSAELLSPLDANGDGVVTTNEFLAHGKALVFSIFDANSDGLLTVDEYQALRSAAGTWAGTIRAMVADEFDNPISNQPLRLKVLPAQPVRGGPKPLPAGAKNMVVYPSTPPCPNPAPLLGDCNGVSELTLDTFIFGASVETILGDTVGTKFQVQADILGKTTVAPVVFTKFSGGDREYGSGAYNHPVLSMALRELINERGLPVNATKTGTSLGSPLEVFVYLIEDNYALEPVEGEPGYRIRSLETNRVRPIDHGQPGEVSFAALIGSVQANRAAEKVETTFTVAEGNGTLGAKSNPGAGRHGVLFTAGSQAALNKIEVQTSATVWVPCFDLTFGSVTPKLVTLKAIQGLHNPKTCGEFGVNPEPGPLLGTPLKDGTIAPLTLKHQVFGVNPTLPSAVAMVHRPQEELTQFTLKQTTPVPYAIEPSTSAPPYVAAAAEIDLFASEPDGDKEEWLGLLPGRPTFGKGEALLFQGTALDPLKQHEMQLVLNRGSSVEIRSDRVPLHVVSEAALHVTARDLKTRIDRVHQEMCHPEGTGMLTIKTTRDADVTIEVDGHILTVSAAGGMTTYNAYPLPPGLHEIPITPGIIPIPGEHLTVVTAVFKQAGSADVTQTATTQIRHQVEIFEFMPLGHTLVKDVNVHSGQVTLTREDVAIPGVGPTLRFTRSYSSVGNETAGPLGAGWTHNYNARLYPDFCGSIMLAGGEGSGVRFHAGTVSKDSGGNEIVVYKARGGFHGSLVYNKKADDDSYDFYNRSRFRYHYIRPQHSAEFYRLSFIEDPHGNRLTLAYQFAWPFHVEKVTDAAGRTLTFQFAIPDEATSAAIIAGPRLSAIKGPLGLAVSFGYDSHGNLTSTTRATRTEHYEYTVDQPRDRHNLAAVIDPNGNRTEYRYYSAADPFPGENTNPALGSPLAFPAKHEFVKSVTEGPGTPDETVHTFAYDYSAYPLSVSSTVELTAAYDKHKRQRIYTLNGRGHLSRVRVLHDEGEQITQTTWTYEESGNPDDVHVAREIDPAGRVTQYFYDANGNMREKRVLAAGPPYAPVTDASRNAVAFVSTLYEYDLTFNKLTKETDPEGNSTVYGIDPKTGDIWSQTRDPNDGTGPVTTYTYRSAHGLKGLLDVVTDPLGRLTRYVAYDQYGNATDVTDALGNLVTNQYDARSRLLESKDTTGHRTVYAYNDLDLVERVTRYAGQQPADAALTSDDQITLTTYRPGGDKKTVTVCGSPNKCASEPLQQISYAYDALNRLRVQTDHLEDADDNPVVIKTHYDYDAQGNKIREVDGREILHEFVYDGLNRLREERVAGQVVTAYTYDEAGNRISETDLHKHTTSFEYDWLDRQVKAILPIAPYFTASQFDRAGNLLRTRDANGHGTQMTYDGLNRVRSKVTPSATIKISYDKVGNQLQEENETSGLTVVHTYDALNRRKSTTQQFTDPLTGQKVSHVTAYGYNDPAHVREIFTPRTTPRKPVIRELYNGLDQLIEETIDYGAGGLNLVRMYAYDALGNRSAEKDAEGAEVDRRYVHDGRGRRIRTTLPLGGEEKIFYDGNGNLIRSIDPRGIVRRFEYDDLDRPKAEILVEAITNGGQELVLTRTEYDDVQNVTRITQAPNENSSTTTHYFDAMHREIRTVDALGRDVLMEWDGVNKTAETDKRAGRRTRREFSYEAANRIVKIQEFSAGQLISSLQTTYLDKENRRIETDRRGIETITQLDALQRVRRVSRRHPDLAREYGATEIRIQEIDYDEHGNQVRITDANGNATEFVYDGADRRIRQIEAARSGVAATTAYSYDGAGNLLTVKDGRAHGRPFDRRYAYDARYRKRTDENALGDTTLFDYDQNGNLLSVTDPKGTGYTTRYEYDELDNLILVDETERGGGVTRYQYDANRNKIAQQDADSNLMTFNYDKLNRLTARLEHGASGALRSVNRKEPAGGDEPTARRWSFGYDENSNEISIVDAEDQRVEKSYDYLDRLVRKSYSNHKPAVDGSVLFPQLLSVDFRYDPNDNLIGTEETKRPDSVNTVKEVARMEYDHLDREIASTNYDGKVVRYRYDRAGNRTSLVDADGRPTTYTFDARNRLVSVTAATSTAPTRYVYWEDGLERMVVHPNGTITDQEYDAADRVVRIATHDGNPAAPISIQTYAYDRNGNPSLQSEIRRHWGAIPEQTTYAYDRLNRLTEVKYPGGTTVAYTLSLNGNRLSEGGTDPATGAPLNRRYTYDRLNQLLAVHDTVDPNASVSYAYDKNGNTVQKTIGPLNTSNGEHVVKTYDYDIRDQLTLADQTNSGGRMLFDYDYAGRRVKMRWPTPAVEIRYLYDDNAVLQEYDGTALATTLKYTYGRRLLSLVTNGGQSTFFYHLDGRDSVSELTDQSGQILASYLYDAWGGLRKSFDLTPNRRRFTGHYTDPETGFQYFGARYYDDTTGRFLTQDSYLGDPTQPPTLHRYLYANANPLAYVDLDGREAVDLVAKLRKPERRPHCFEGQTTLECGFHLNMSYLALAGAGIGKRVAAAGVEVALFGLDLVDPTGTGLKQLLSGSGIDTRGPLVKLKEAIDERGVFEVAKEMVEGAKEPFKELASAVQEGDSERITGSLTDIALMVLPSKWLGAKLGVKAPRTAAGFARATVIEGARDTLSREFADMAARIKINDRIAQMQALRHLHARHDPKAPDFSFESGTPVPRITPAPIQPVRPGEPLGPLPAGTQTAASVGQQVIRTLQSSASVARGRATTTRMNARNVSGAIRRISTATGEETFVHTTARANLPHTPETAALNIQRTRSMRLTEGGILGQWGEGVYAYEGTLPAGVSAPMVQFRVPPGTAIERMTIPGERPIIRLVPAEGTTLTIRKPIINLSTWRFKSAEWRLDQLHKLGIK